MSAKLGSKLQIGAKRKKLTIGWREWVGLPDLGIDQIKVKVDTGARTSALHAFKISTFTESGATFVNFKAHPLQRRRRPEIDCTALVIDKRNITDSGGKSSERFIIRTTLWIGDMRWPIELSLINRDEMGFRMLLGRQALRHKLLIDPAKSFTLKKTQ